MKRRSFLGALASTTLSAAALGPAGWAQAPTTARRKMTICLSPGSIGVSANQIQTLDLAKQYGFESVEPFGDFLASLPEDQMAKLLEDLRAKSLSWGTAGLPVEFRQDESRFNDGLQRLAKIASGLQRAGVTRVGTWLSPGHPSVPFLQNHKLHATRLRAVAQVLQDHGQRLGLEYVGTKTSRDGVKFPFVHTLAELQDLIAEIGTGNVGVVLDSWHWWQAGDTEADLLSLRNEDVVSVDLNDAPSGVAKDQQRDNRRELPLATGVIPVAAFLGALNRIGYDGPVRAEPFNKALNDLDNEAACAATVAAMKRAFATLG